MNYNIGRVVQHLGLLGRDAVTLGDLLSRLHSSSVSYRNRVPHRTDGHCPSEGAGPESGTYRFDPPKVVESPAAARARPSAWIALSISPTSNGPPRARFPQLLLPWGPAG